MEYNTLNTYSNNSDFIFSKMFPKIAKKKKKGKKIQN